MSKPLISLIACIGKNRELGLNNDLIWKIPDDLAHFKKVTKNHVIVMGQKTYESIGRALPERINIVLSDDKSFNPQGVIVVRSMKEALKIANGKEEDEIFFIGGAFVYKQAIEFAQKLYLTQVDEESEADAYFPEFTDFTVIEKSPKKSYKDISYQYQIMERNG